MGRVGKLSGSWGNRIWWVTTVVVQSRGRSLTYWPVICSQQQCITIIPSLLEFVHFFLNDSCSHCSEMQSQCGFIMQLSKVTWVQTRPENYYLNIIITKHFKAP